MAAALNSPAPIFRALLLVVLPLAGSCDGYIAAHGRVYTLAGDPLEGAQVKLQLFDPKDPSRSRNYERLAQTSADGRYSISSVFAPLSRAERPLQASHRGFKPGRAYAKGNSITEVNFFLAPADSPLDSTASSPAPASGAE